jgi:hypothetical protein
MKQRIIKRIIYFILIAFFCCSCVNKKTQKNENIDKSEILEKNEIIDKIDMSPLKLREDKIIKFNDDEIIMAGDLILSIKSKGAIDYVNRDILTVYTDYTKESDRFLTDYKGVYLIGIDENPDWFYLISYDKEIQGYIYIYDISEKSFYGDLDKMKTSGNYYESLLNTEYEIIKRHKNIKRYGPLLTIEHSGKVTKIWDTGNGFPPVKKHLLLNYYPKYNEVLMLQQYYEGSRNFIYNLEFDEYRSEDIGDPYFNNARTFLATVVYIEDIGTYIIKSVEIHRISNGYYERIYEKSVEIKEEWYYNETIRWINDNKVCFDYGKAGSITINIGNDISFESTLALVFDTY